MYNIHPVGPLCLSTWFWKAKSRVGTDIGEYFGVPKSRSQQSRKSWHETTRVDRSDPGARSQPPSVRARLCASTICSPPSMPLATALPAFALASPARDIPVLPHRRRTSLRDDETFGSHARVQTAKDKGLRTATVAARSWRSPMAFVARGRLEALSSRGAAKPHITYKTPHGAAPAPRFAP